LAASLANSSPVLPSGVLLKLLNFWGERGTQLFLNYHVGLRLVSESALRSVQVATFVKVF
jgi:hypothetical protein